MYLLGYSIDNLSLMALTISTGFVVDDAIVVMENIARHLEEGMEPFAAALKGAQEIGFTVLSISASLIAVFMPILLMGGLVGRLFREFAMTLTISIVVSMIVSLTTTPMMCAILLRRQDKEKKHNWFYRTSERFFDWVHSIYRGSLLWVLDHTGITMTVFLLTLGLNLVVMGKVSKGFFPDQDTGAILGGVQGRQDASFPYMNNSMLSLSKVINHVSHELGAPLTRMHLSLALLRREFAGAKSGALVRIERETDKLSNLVQQLLLLAGLEPAEFRRRCLRQYRFAPCAKALLKTPILKRRMPTARS